MCCRIRAELILNCSLTSPTGLAVEIDDLLAELKGRGRDKRELEIQHYELLRVGVG